MRKFGKLIGNEWKKLFRRKATWVMLILLLLFSVGFSALNSVSVIFDYDDFWTPADDARSQIEYYNDYIKDVDEEGNPTEMALECMEKKAYFQYIADADIRSYEDWRLCCTLIDEMAAAKLAGSDDLAELEKIFFDSDYKGYFRRAIDKNKELYADDPDELRVENWLYEYCLENDVIPSAEEDWRYGLVTEVSRAEKTLLWEERMPGSTSELQLENAKNMKAIGLYRLEHNMASNPADCFPELGTGDTWISGSDRYGLFWCSFASSSSLVTFAGLFLIVIAGSIVSNEFSQGTIKFLLVNPVKRWKILASKYCTVLLMGVLFIASVFAASFLSSILLSGTEGVFSLAVSAKNGELSFASPFLLLIRSYLLSAVEIVVSASLAFAISSLLRSSALAIGISMFAYLSGSLIVVILQAFQLDWARYILFANLDFNAIVRGTTLFPHQSLTDAIIIVSLHMVVFLLTAWDAFVHREV